MRVYKGFDFELFSVELNSEFLDYSNKAIGRLTRNIKNAIKLQLTNVYGGNWVIL